jgi:hypothetical protein
MAEVRPFHQFDLFVTVGLGRAISGHIRRGVGLRAARKNEWLNSGRWRASPSGRELPLNGAEFFVRQLSARSRCPPIKKRCRNAATEASGERHSQ